jgi:hypothetical protein
MVLWTADEIERYSIAVNVYEAKNRKIDWEYVASSVKTRNS